MASNWNSVKADVEENWDKTIISALSEYIEVPNQSPSFDPEWASNGLMEKAFDILIEWMKGQNIQGLTYEYVHGNGRTPFLIIQIAGTEATKNTVLMYGHMDKQPPLRPWSDGLDPHKAVIRDDKLYGRGGADDGYALFSSIAAIAALQRNGIPHGRIVITIEAGEESGSPDLDFYMEHYKDTIGQVDLMICLDSGSLNFDQVWLTTSLRGMAAGVLHVQTVREGMHSGLAGGVVPDTFRIARQLLDRVENVTTAEVLLPEAHCEIPAHVREAYAMMREVDFKEQFPTLEGVATEDSDNLELALRNFWKPSLTVVGANLPDVATAGNVIRKETALKLSLRTPPLVDADKALAALEKALTSNPPQGAKVWMDSTMAGSGCSTPALEPWLARALEDASMTAFGKTFASQGCGGSIPFIAMLVNAYPKSQFVVTGILGPHSNAHGPDEFLHIPYVKGVTFSMARIIGEHFHNTPKS